MGKADNPQTALARKIASARDRFTNEYRKIGISAVAAALAVRAAHTPPAPQPVRVKLNPTTRK